MELPDTLLKPKLEKKKNPLRENSLYAGKMELYNSNIKKTSYIFSKKADLIFQETETP